MCAELLLDQPLDGTGMKQKDPLGGLARSWTASAQP
jgi:hypothetical protein